MRRHTLQKQRRRLAERIARTDAAKLRALSSVHGGAGSMEFGVAARRLTRSAPIYLHPSRRHPPRSGIGQHFHNYCEEMFVMLDGAAAIHDRWPHLPELKGPAGAPNRRATRMASTTPATAAAVAQHQCRHIEDLRRIQPRRSARRRRRSIPFRNSFQCAWIARC